MRDATRRPGGDAGGMADRVRARDWSGTAVGPADRWPQSLQTALSICLSSRFPMHVWWGRDRTVFYNDAYVPAMGDKHPAALGRPAAEVWPEAWPELGPMAESVLAGRGATYSEDQQLFLRRHGYLEETYWTFSYSPIQDETGGVGGIFVAVTETTSRVVGERRLRVLGDVGELSTMSAGTAEEASRAVIGLLARHRADVPFVAAYLRAADGSLQLVASSGVAAGGAVAPRSVGGPSDAEPVWRVAHNGTTEVVRGLIGDAADQVEAAAAGPAVPADAVVAPLMIAGRAEPAGVLVAGVNPYRALDGDYRSFFDLVADQLSTAITDALAYEAERQRAEALAELDRAKTDFFSNVSHEFRTPLTLIMGPVAELRAAPAVVADPWLREELDVVHRNALRLGKLVNSLLDFSRLQAGRVEAHFEPVDLAAYTAELASVFRSAVERAGVAYDVDCRTVARAGLRRPGHVGADRPQPAVQRREVHLRGPHRVGLRHHGRSVVLTVTDTGIGIPADELPRLFERFHRVERARARSGEGSGIGLAMVRELVGLHGGAIAVDSKPDRGTTFTVTLPAGPRAPAAGPDRPGGRRRRPARSTCPPSPSPSSPRRCAGSRTAARTGRRRPRSPAAAAQGRVLVADDNADMREYLSRLLAPRYAVQAVGDGAAALAAAPPTPRPRRQRRDDARPRRDGARSPRCAPTPGPPASRCCCSRPAPGRRRRSRAWPRARTTTSSSRSRPRSCSPASARTCSSAARAARPRRGSPPWPTSPRR